MSKRKRDFHAEYRRRITRGESKGQSKAQARGHRKASEPHVTHTRAEKALEDAKLQIFLRILREEKVFTKAAKEARISPERALTIALEKGIIEKRGRRWVIKKKLRRRVLIYSEGHERQIIVGDFEAASLVGSYMSMVGAFARTNKVELLRPFKGKTVTDQDGKSYTLETRPNVLHRLSHAGGNSFEQIYRIVV